MVLVPSLWDGKSEAPKILAAFARQPAFLHPLVGMESEANIPLPSWNSTLPVEKKKAEEE